MKKVFKMVFPGLFPERARSFEEFIALVTENECSKVEVIPTTNGVVNSRAAGVPIVAMVPPKGYIGTVYYIHCIATTMRGEKIVYDHDCVVRYVPDHEYAADRELHEFQIHHDARWCAMSLRRKLSGVEVRIPELPASTSPAIKVMHEKNQRTEERTSASSWNHP